MDGYFRSLCFVPFSTALHDHVPVPAIASGSFPFIYYMAACALGGILVGDRLFAAGAPRVDGMHNGFQSGFRVAKVTMSATCGATVAAPYVPVRAHGCTHRVGTYLLPRPWLSSSLRLASRKTWTRKLIARPGVP